jgi:hypothetical protein
MNGLKGADAQHRMRVSLYMSITCDALEVDFVEKCIDWGRRRPATFPQTLAGKKRSQGFCAES